jgi:hypothetical protein
MKIKLSNQTWGTAQHLNWDTSCRRDGLSTALFTLKLLLKHEAINVMNFEICSSCCALRCGKQDMGCSVHGDSVLSAVEFHCAKAFRGVLWLRKLNFITRTALQLCVLCENVTHGPRFEVFTEMRNLSSAGSAWRGDLLQRNVGNHLEEHMASQSRRQDRRYTCCLTGSSGSKLQHLLVTKYFFGVYVENIKVNTANTATI